MMVEGWPKCFECDNDAISMIRDYKEIEDYDTGFLCMEPVAQHYFCAQHKREPQCVGRERKMTIKETE